MSSEHVSTSQADAAAALPRAAGDLLTVGFFTTVMMWTIGYFSHLPAAQLVMPTWLVLLLLLAACAGGGVIAGRITARGWRGGLYAGLITGTLNLMMFLSVISEVDTPNQLQWMAWLWIPSTIALTAAVMSAGAAWGARTRSDTAWPGKIWPSQFAGVAALATVVLLSLGGAVTGAEAGLAVPDWPNSFGYNMFLFPLTKMTGGIYFEHAHRLFGSLVGLTTVVLCILVHRTDNRRWIRWLSIVAVAMVIVQGLMGGTRVTGEFTMSMDRAELRPNDFLAIVHGVFGQVFLATLMLIAAALTPTWRAAERASAADEHHGDEVPLLAGLGNAWLPLASILLILTQIIFGALVRHNTAMLHMHITLAFVVAGFGGFAGLRAWGRHEEITPVARSGGWLLSLIAVQLMLGFAALGTLALDTAAGPHWLQVLVTTMHQTLGALILAAATTLAAWQWRLLPRPASNPAPATHTEHATAATS